ncbi:VanZ family protein [Priestia megaterium]|uniref:VanZ family protein n=1 Tax=Priestia megaterium TaxID=1404 RepID=UPI002E244759|nr:VanZ family protein [Priestia megaterium]
MFKKILINVMFLGSIIFITNLTMLPDPSLDIGIGSGGVNLIPFHSIGGWISHQSLHDFIVNNIGNVILFIPFGFMLPLRFKKVNRLSKSLLIGMFFSILIEIIQLTMPNRWTDVDDVILNTLGTGVGYSLFTILNRVYKLT